MDPPPRRLSTWQAWSTAVIATLVMSVSYVDRQTLAVLAPTVREALHISHGQFGIVLAAFSVSYLVGAPIAGALLDRAGARRGLVLAVLAWSTVAAAHALVPTFGALVLMRILLGVTEAPSFPGAVQTIKRVMPPAQRSAGIGLLFSGSSLGAMIAAPVAIGIHRATHDWRIAFFGTALVGLLWIPAWIALTSRPAVRAALASDDSPVSDAARAETSRVALFTSAPVMRALVVVVLAAPSIMFCLNWSAQYLADTYALPQDALARYLWLPPVLFDLGAIAFGALASRADVRAGLGVPRTHTALMMTAALLSSSMAAMPFVHDPWLATALASSCLAGGGGVFALLTGDMLARVAPSHVSTAGGLSAAAQSLAYVIANPLVGFAVDRTRSYAMVLITLGAVVPPAAIAWAMWPMRGARTSGPRVTSGE